jgi:hypothetical protein
MTILHRPASNMHPMTFKIKLIRAAALLLFGAALGAGILMLTGQRIRIPRPAKPCRDCAAPTGTPERESDEGHAKLGPSEPGDWRHRFHETPQDFESYRSYLVNWKCAHRTTFYIQPWGSGEAVPRDAGADEDLRRRAFSGPAKVLDPIPNVRGHVRRSGDKCRSLMGVAHPPAEGCPGGIGMAELDPPGLNFVLGWRRASRWAATR